MGLLLHFVAVADDAYALAERLVDGSAGLDGVELGEDYEIDAVHDCLAAVFEDLDAPAGWIIYGGRDAGADIEAVVLDAADLLPLVDLMASLDFNALLDERIAEVQELYRGSLDEDDRTGLREYFDDVRSFYARAAAAGHSVIKWV